MYKDKDKQKEANKERVRRYRALQKGVTSDEALQEGVTPKDLPMAKCVPSIEVRPTRHWNQDVDLPGDEGYRGCCFDEAGIWHVKQENVNV
jgi:hypothetical protein